MYHDHAIQSHSLKIIPIKNKNSTFLIQFFYFELRMTVWHYDIAILHYIYAFSRRFFPKRLTNEDNRSNQNEQKSNDMQVL